MLEKLQRLFAERFNYNKQEQQIIESWVTEKKELELIADVQNSPGWQLIEQKIREELKMTILALVKDDKKIDALLQVLSTMNTKTRTENLRNAIEDVVQEH